jgi:hypothetical protein
MSASENSRSPSKRPGTAAKPFSIRLTDAERQELSERAGGKPLATYLRDLVLTTSLQAPRLRLRARRRDDEALARVLAALGQSRIANNLNQLAKAVNIGALPVTPETNGEIADACSAVVAMRLDLMRALGLHEEQQR